MDIYSGVACLLCWFMFFLIIGLRSTQKALDKKVDELLKQMEELEKDNHQEET